MSMLSDFFEVLRNFGLEYYERYYSVYPGIVTDVDDPDKRGRIKVILPGLLGNDQEMAVWVLPISNPLAGSGTGAFFPPYVDDTVLVMFEFGDIDYPVYIGGFWAEEELADEFLEGYPNVRGWKFKSGQSILIDESEGKLKTSIINGPSGSVFIMDETEGKETISLIHNTGAMLQVDKNGGWSLATPEGNLVFLNEKTGEVTVKSATGAIVSLKDKIVASDASGKNMISITDSTVEVIASSDAIITAKNINIKGGNISLGGDADNVVLYKKLADIFDKHTHLTPVGSSTPPIPPMTMLLTGENPALSAKSKNVTIKGNL